MNAKPSTIALAGLAALFAANLAVEAVKLIRPAHAAAAKRYQIVPYDDAPSAEAILNKHAQDGWELVLIEPKSGAFILEKN